MTELKTAEDHIEALMAIHPKGFDLSLDRITRLLEVLGNPQDKLPPVLHFAGTNGKGSAIAFSRAILEAAGLSVHVHTSPHLVNWHERYRLGRKGQAGELVSDAMLADALGRVAKANGGEPITVFEVLTVVTFLLFSENPADICLIEVGLGGRFDATNVMKETAVSIITPISLDHEAYLGDTLAKIAFEKAGIIKPGTPVVIGPQEDDALDVIERQAAKKRSATLVSGQRFNAQEERGRLVYQSDSELLDLALPALPGAHQYANAATAIAATQCLAGLQGFELTAEHISTGLRNTQWPGRMQKLTQGILFDALPDGSEIWLDGGHNPGAAAMIAEFMGSVHSKDPRKLTLICGMLNTKDPTGYFQALSQLVDQVVTVPIVSSDAGIPSEELSQYASFSGLKSVASSSLQDALSTISGAGKQRVLVAGSLYLVGDALAQNGTPPQ